MTARKSNAPFGLNDMKNTIGAISVQIGVPTHDFFIFRVGYMPYLYR